MGRRIAVTGAGGFIGHHLVNRLVREGNFVRGIDIKYPEFEPTAAHEFAALDLRRYENCLRALAGMEQVYQLAADMGGIGFITGNHAEITRNNTMINMNTLEAARVSGVKRFLFSSSACVYPQHLQNAPDVAPLREETAWPADPEPGYGLEKLYMEKMCQYFREDFGIETRVVRFHNVYGPLGTWRGGREKAPAAVCRKLAGAQSGDEIEVWGDGLQTRSFMYIDDCLEGLLRLMESDYTDPLNLGSDELVTINELFGIVAGIAGKKIHLRHNLAAPQGVRGRNSDNSNLRTAFGWQPSIRLRDGLRTTYAWIAEQVEAARATQLASAAAD